MDQAAERLFSAYLEDVSEAGDIRAGSPLPLGAHHRGDGTNFALFSRHATAVRLEFFDRPSDSSPSRVIALDPLQHRTGDVWHVWVQGVLSGQLYAYRVEGPYCPQKGYRFNPNKLLLDPYATAVTRFDKWDWEPARGYDPSSPHRDLVPSALDDGGLMPKCIYTRGHFHWEGDRPPRHPWSEIVVYETHVRGCTIHSSSGVKHPGTYRGLMEKIPYFKDLGITAVELMPVQEFNEQDAGGTDPFSGQPLEDYWGYNPVTFVAPKASYCSCGGLGHQTLEFKEMVRAFHRAGIEVILDVVFTHTAEGNELGPTISYRGLDNTIFYMLEKDRRFYKDFTGTGNTINANHPVVRGFILDALRYWVVEMHVDGFRFDLASVLGRDQQGNLLSDSPLLERIAEDPILREIKIIAEAWDAAGAYQVGSFSECRWAEWNGQYRDDVRCFWRGDEGMLDRFASRICGSADIYQRSGKGPESSINFITCHDGFTLNDLVSYDHKHNESNGHDNRDGVDENYSHNYGIEGETADPSIEAVRRRQIKNLLLTLFVSRGVPMLLGGDEFRRTQLGNNNAYCQDNEISWYDWTYLGRHQEVYQFAHAMIAFRREHPVLREEAFYTDADIQWLAPTGGPPNWSDPKEKRLGCLILGQIGPDLLLLFNASTEATSFALPCPPCGRRWHLVADTMQPAPNDQLGEDEEILLEDQSRYSIGPRSSVILLAVLEFDRSSGPVAANAGHCALAAHTSLADRV